MEQAIFIKSIGGIMKKITLQTAVVIFSVILFWSCQKQESTKDAVQADNSASLRKSYLTKKGPGIQAVGTISVFATGLNNPRGLEFGPDGNLYVAEGGTGGTTSTAGQCEQVIFPVGPYLGSTTGGRISKITPAGVRTTVTDQLPSSQSNEIIGGDISGVSDVAFMGNTMYALLAGAGCSHGVASIPNGVVRINPDGTSTMVADISAWLRSHPVAQPEEADFEPDGTPYSMLSLRGDLYVVEPNQGELLKITTDGTITRIIDFSASEGHIVPTAMAYHGNFYVGNLNTFPIEEGSANIYKVTPDGTIKTWVTGLTTVLGVVFDQQKRMYVLENTVGAPFPTPGLGRIIRIDPSGKKETIATGLSLPTAMTLGPDGNLYISNWGFGPAAIGGGQVVKVEVKG
jgi:hypothetical protein